MPEKNDSLVNMGVDYGARKLAKKRRKSTIDPELESEGSKRKRKSKLRRLCQGMCYGPPLLTPADAFESGDEEEAGMYARQAALVTAQSQQPQPAARLSMTGRPGSEPGSEPGTEPPAKRKRNRKKLAAEGAAHQSTAIKLIKPEPDRAPVARPQHADPAAGDGLVAFAEWPEPIQRYMTSEGFEVPTPIQEKCVSA